MITIKNKIQSSNPTNRYFITHDWMMGDCAGNFTTQQIISKDNPLLDKFLSCCIKLKTPLPGTWGNVLDKKTIQKCLGEDYEFFKQFTYDSEGKELTEYAEDLFFEPETEKGRIFVTYQGFKIILYDENGTAFNCEYTNDENSETK